MRLRRLMYVFIISVALLGFLNPASSWAGTLGVNLSGPFTSKVAAGEYSFTASASGGSGNYEYEWWVKYQSNSWVNKSVSVN